MIDDPRRCVCANLRRAARAATAVLRRRSLVRVRPGLDARVRIIELTGT